jgi:uncharacterized membrane protein YjjB (DUF3815 family)
MDLRETLILVFSGFLGTIGFSILFRSNRNRILCNAVGGALTCLVYALCCNAFDHIFLQNFFPALFVSAYAEIMARIVKAPATPILACSIISLVPGGKLYYTTYYCVVGDMEKFDTTLTETLQIAAGLAVGIICISVIIHEINWSRFKHILNVD